MTNLPKTLLTVVLSTFYILAISQQFGSYEIFVDNLYSCRGATDVKAADLDNDGDMDVIACSNSTHHIFCYENLGNKEFGPRHIIDDNLLATTVLAVGDFDGDGFIDIASIDAEENILVWYKNMGNQTFSDPILIANEVDKSKKIIASDIDNDGKMDLVLSVDNNLLFFKGEGNGTWLPPKTIIPNVPFDKFIISDLNGDNLKDIVFFRGSCAHLIYSTQSAGVNFVTEVIVDDKSCFFDLVSTDLDGDGDQDLIASRFNVNSDIELLCFKNENSNFSKTPVIISTADYRTNELIANDVDDDGDIDLVGATNSKIILYRNEGVNNFELEIITDKTDLATGVFFADLDNDDDMDLLSCSAFDSKVSWYENFETNNFSEQRNITYNVDRVSDLHYGDLNNDGLIDVISVNGISNVVGWYKNLGENKFSHLKTILQDYDGAKIAEIVDVNNDGFADIISGGSPDVLLFKNNGNETFTEMGSIYQPTVQGPNNIVSEDIDDDGDLDILLTYSLDCRIQMLSNDGDGAFNLVKTIEVCPNNILDLKFADADSDGLKDIFYLTVGNQSVGYYKNEGNFNFSTPNGISGSPYGFGNIDVADMNNDGLVDLISYTHIYNEFALYQNLGNGNFGPQVILPTNSRIQNFALGDIDQDGWQDIVAANSQSNNGIDWYKNNGDITFSLQPRFGDNESAWEVHLVDMDNDADLDILVSGYDGESSQFGNLGIFENKSNVCSASSTTTIEVIIQNDESYTLPDGSVVSMSGSYTTSIIGADGCVLEVIITNLSVCPAPAQTTEEVIIFEGETYMLANGNIVSEPGSYTIIIFDDEGCKAERITTVLTVCPNLEDSEVLVSLAGGETHTLPNGEVVDEEGTYTVTVEDADGCPSTIVTIITILTSVKPVIGEDAISLFPNPSFGHFVVEIEERAEAVSHISINSPFGGKVYESKLVTSRHQVDIKRTSPGLYILHLWDSQGNLLGSKKLVLLK